MVCGQLYITSCRMAFVNDNYSKSQFVSFDMPIANLFQESFEQPVFGSNYLKGKAFISAAFPPSAHQCHLKTARAHEETNSPANSPA